ncbi:protein transport protein Sec61 subunit beta [Trifolium repens]|nr:protein transport protein Sec61 subunit beta [Trifolium repens]
MNLTSYCIPLSLLTQIQLANHMKNGNKCNKANAHNKNDIWGDFESRSIIGIKLKHSPCSSSRRPTTRCLPSPHASSSCCTSSLGSCST